MLPSEAKLKWIPLPFVKSVQGKQKERDEVNNKRMWPREPEMQWATHFVLLTFHPGAQEDERATQKGKQ